MGKTVDGVDVKLSLPEGLGGEGVKRGTTTPEDLFAAGYAACFGGALAAVAPSLKLEPATIGVHADTMIGRDDDKALGLGVRLTGFFTGITEAEGMKLMETAHGVCPYSKATRDNIEVELKVIVAELKH